MSAKAKKPLDRDLVAKVKAAATVLAGNIGSGFIDAAAKLRALI